MADQDVRLQGPNKAVDTSRERVAFDLMEKIGHLEPNENKTHHGREYWLKLYIQCYAAAHGFDDKIILKRL